MKVYLAAPLFNVSEQVYNELIKNMLQGAGFDVYLPQFDSGEAAKGCDRAEIFRKDIGGLDEVDLVVAVLDGIVMDPGTCWEIGYAYALNKPVIGLWTDARSFMDGYPNVMIQFGCEKICLSEQALMEELELCQKKK